MIRLILATLALLFGSPALADPLIIAHRGASGERPEHTRAAYDLAIQQGADVIEPDLVISRDGVLIVRHENEIGETTDVATHPEFADRHTTKTVDGRPVAGWFAEDFTLAELKTLRARERLPDLRPANTAFDGQDPILTFEEVLDIAAAAGVGIAPELKHPTYFAALGLPMEDAFVAVLERRGLTGADAPILIQCFEVAPLQRLRARIAAPLLQLVAASGRPFDRPDLDYAAMVTPEGLAAVAAYADWIGADTALIEPVPGRPTALIPDAHAAGLKVAAWTFRAENAFLPEADRIGSDPATHGRLRERLARFAGYGLDAAFMDQPALGR
ncbi:MAG: glycerophosphodiester phosphodiesterase [Alphaproteobacteria bacterium]|jgi:glycerophosphoryl diester phosphodiesterase|nr:glycerophosphodiester phosphodiesterase [Alphaproteobacteria bacterium]MBU2041907.1 glycerophosphodiester phosphodiesterase [Alphaproteobacteria bacterium]MBU2125770.1 glycerophosphodiester phosphodiesterase [Alphaproteobacteria bacterium]MBU2209711.1 glycerophosphodiester phosphodiesterase [Alphaproteobacteria bacterium]MBU2292176.1 glycerophosphodiester phosphodiesterase [Alphaproteobacteria bacterium]